MPGILGVPEPKKLGGQQRVNQKMWPQSWLLRHQGQLAIRFPRDPGSGLLCSSSGSPDLSLICLLLGSQVQSCCRSLGGECMWNTYLVSIDSFS